MEVHRFSSSTSWWCLSYSSSTECVFPRCEQTGTTGLRVVKFLDKVASRVCNDSRRDKVVDVPVVTRCCGALCFAVKEFHIFSTCTRAVRMVSGPYFLEPFVSGSHLPLCVETVHGGFWTNFFQFLRERWDSELVAQFALGNFWIISTSSIWQSPRASVHGALGIIFQFFNVKVDSEIPAQFCTWKSGQHFYSQSYGGWGVAVGGCEEFFRAPPRS